MRFFLHDCNPCLVAWRVNSGDQAPVKSADKALFERGNLGRGAIGTKNDLFAVIIKGIKGVEEFFLALLAFAQELDVVDYQHIDSAELALKAGQVSFFDTPDKSVDKLFTTQELDYRTIEFSLGFKADRLQKMGLAQAGIAVDKKRIVGISKRVTYRNTACVGKTVARAHHKIVKGIIGMEFKFRAGELRAARRFFVRLWRLNLEVNSDKMAGYLLGSTGEGVFTIITQKPGGRLIGTADPERAAIQMQNRQPVEPLAGVSRVKRLCAVEYISENIFNFPGCQATLLYE
jgi:hypothetical protein